MTFGDLKSRAGQQALNNYLASKSYVEGYLASQADNVVFEALGAAPPADLFHALRFFKHISSYSEVERKAFPGSHRSKDNSHFCTLPEDSAFSTGTIIEFSLKKCDDTTSTKCFSVRFLDFFRCKNSGLGPMLLCLI